MDTFELTVVTPAGRILKEQVKSAELPMVDGQIGVLPHHCDYVGILGIGEIEYALASGEKRKVPVSEGTIQFASNTLTVLADK